MQKEYMSDMRKTAMVTGGSAGIGKAVCECFVRSGIKVIIVDVNEEKGRLAADSFGSECASFIAADVSSFAAVQAAYEAVCEPFGEPDILINNAGIQTHIPFLEMTEEDWDRTLAVDLKSVFNCTRTFLPPMITKGWGRVVNIASMSARRGSNNHVHYCTAKTGILGFTRALSLEAARYGVTVNAVCPGIVETDMIGETMKLKRDIWLTEMHVKRFGSPQDIAAMVSFLITEEAGWISGQAYDVNGGIVTP